MKQGDPLSLLLFCLAEEVLSKGISKLVNDEKLHLISGSIGVHVPSHVLYADDVIIFCRATQQNLSNLKNLFNRYAEISGQIISSRKSTFYLGATCSRRQSLIAEFLGFSIGRLPFNYLGVPIFRGKSRRVHL